ncbi:MAG: TonB-dependent receptor [Acidobacteriota bacterium]
MRPLHRVFVCFLAVGLLFGALAQISLAQSQATAADLTGVIKDESGAVIPGATVTVKNPQTNFERVANTDESGTYKILAIPPGTYQVIAEAAGFSKLVNENVVLTLGQAARLDLALKVTGVGEEVVVTAAPEVVETSKTAVTQTIDQQRIDNLPINGRNFLNFALTNSQIGRDNSPPLGPAPTTGLNFGGQRARSNLVQVDGADNIDNSVNAAKSTISQEAVQEFQVVMNSFAAEFGRTAGGVVNIVTKSGTNEYHGNVFGFIRHRSIQARNALAFPPPGADRKPAFTRGQYGFTFGGPIKKDTTFFFLSLDQTRRHESGFSQIGLDPSIFDLTPAQKAFIASSPAGALYGSLVTSGAQVAKTGIDPNTGQPVFFSTFLLSGGQLGRIPASFKVLTNLQNVYPVSDEFTFYSAKIDHQININNRISGRYTFTPATTTGIQSSGQNQPFGLNDVSRTGIATFRDTAVVVQDLHTFSPTKVNEFLFNFGRRGTLFTSSPDISLNISGAAFLGREPFSPVDRVEKRYEIKDNFTYASGNHTFKFGGDINFVRINPARFELNFSGLFNFGDLPAGALSPALAGAPPITAVQTYGLGLPQVYVQGFGRSTAKFTNKTFGIFAQDSWKIRPNITLNYGVRYDVELTPVIKPVGITTDRLTLSADQLDAAERALNVLQGIPRDKNNVAPRIAIAWDPKGDGKTVIRAAYGIFFDHPLLALAFNADIADATQSPQFLTIAGSPLPTNPLNAVQIFQGTLIPGVTPGVDRGAVYLFGQSRFDPFSPFPGYGSILPFTLPLDRDFVYAYTNQVNVSIERQIFPDVAVNATYIFTGGRKLPHVRDRNTPNAQLLLAASPLGTPTPLTIANNFFRPSGPNPVFVMTARPIPFSRVQAQESSSSSVYHALSLGLSKRFSNNFQALVSYSFTKTIDDSTDLQTLLQPQDNNNPGSERGLSNFDQRHRFVFSAVFKSPYEQDSATGFKKILANFTFSPIVELSSGRPFNILTGIDTNLDQSGDADRPNVDPATGRLSLPALGQAGSLGRNAGIAPGFASVDLRLARNLPIGERVKIDFIGEVFNLFNRVNVSTVNNNFRFVTFDEDKFKSPPTAVFDPRQFQFAIKVTF